MSAETAVEPQDGTELIPQVSRPAEASQPVWRLLFPWAMVLLYGSMVFRIDNWRQEATWCVVGLSAIIASDLRAAKAAGEVPTRNASAGWLCLTLAGYICLVADLGSFDYARFAPLLIILGLHWGGFTGLSLKRLRMSLLVTAVLVCLWEPLWSEVIESAGYTAACWTAAPAQYALYVAGVAATRTGNVIAIATGSVTVLAGCTGLQVLSATLRMLFAEAVWSQAKYRYGLAVPLLFAIAFLLGIVRVSILVLAQHSAISFHFWHQGPGNGLFTFAGVALSFLAFRRTRILER